MMGANDVVGANIKALQSRVCLEYATTLAKFKQHDIERKQRSLKYMDTASTYTLITPSNVPGFLGCDNAFAVFTIMEQKPVKRRLGITQAYSVLVSIQCQYVTMNGKLNTYLFQVIADHDVCNDGFFYQIHVNNNGSLLLLVSNWATYVAQVPTEMDDNSIIPEETTRVYLFTNIVRAELLTNKSKRTVGQTSRTVKVEFHAQYNNIICMMTMEPPDESTTSDERQIDTEHSDGAREEGQTHKIDDEQQGDTTRARLNSTRQVEKQGVVRIFNVEYSIDHPYMEMKLTELCCRTGDDNAKNDTNPYPQGTLVDFYWNTRDEHTWEASTLFIMSNYGYVFAYCPIILPNCLTTFKRKKNIVLGAAELIKQKYHMRSDYKIDAITTEEDIAQLLRCLTNAKQKEKDEQNNDADTFKVIPHRFKLEMKDKAPKQYFEALTVMRTHPEVVILAAGTNGTIMLFKKQYEIKPKTSHFSSQDDSEDIITMRCADNITQRTQYGTRVTFLTLSDDTCITHSTLETNLLRIRHAFMNVKHIAKTKMADEHVYYQSLPIVVTEAGDKHIHESFKDYWNDDRTNIYIIQAIYCYIKAQSEVKHLALTVKKLPCRDLGHTNVNTDTRDCEAEGDIISIQSSTEKNITNTSDARGRENIKNAIQKLQRYASAAERTAQTEFKNAKELVPKNMKNKEKAVELVKIISTIDANVLFYLKTRTVFEAEIKHSLAMYQGIAENAKVVLETLNKYTTKIQKMKERVETLKQQNDEIVKREQRILDLKDELQRAKIKEQAAIKITDLITNVYIRSTQKMAKSITCKINQADKITNYKDCVRTVIDQWLADTLKSNIQDMEKTFKRIQSIRNRIMELD